MSSTNRGGAERQADDHYATPGWTTRAILPVLGPLGNLRIAETSAGRGDIVRELLAAGADPLSLTAVERNEGRAAVVEEMLGVRAACADSLLWKPEIRYDLVVMNPPFSQALQHIDYAMNHVLRSDGICVALLRLAFCTSAARAPFRARWRSSLYPLASRPSFTAEMLTWATDADLLSIAEKVKGTDRLETVGEVEKRLRGSDSSDYGWYFFYGDQAPGGGQFRVLEDASLRVGKRPAHLVGTPS